jgi:hypothetical protein
MAANESSNFTHMSNLKLGTATAAGRLFLAGTEVTATAAELNAVADRSGRLVDLDATSLSVTAALHADRIVTLSHTAAESVVTLPAATGTGNVYTFIVAAVNTNNHKIQVANATDEFAGMIYQIDTDTTDTVTAYPALAADNFDTITLNGTTKGGIVGDRITIIDIASGVFQLEGNTNASGTVASALSAAVS